MAKGISGLRQERGKGVRVWEDLRMTRRKLGVLLGRQTVAALAQGHSGETVLVPDSE